MQYFGGKQRISKPLSEYINKKLQDEQPFVDLFCGSCNIISKIKGNRTKIANDKHRYLINMWKELQNGWIPPQQISREEYIYIKENKDNKPHLTGFVGFGCSFAGKWFGGYATSNSRNYCLNAYNSSLSKLRYLRDVEFLNLNYDEVDIPKGSLVYCDIPYRGTTQYCRNEVGIFNHNEFYNWVKNNSDTYDIYISEYKDNVPDGFEIVWELESKKDIRNKNNERVKTIEVLIKYKK